MITPPLVKMLTFSKHYPTSYRKYRQLLFSQKKNQQAGFQLYDPEVIASCQM